MNDFGFHIHKPVRSKAYKEWIKTQPCIVPQCKNTDIDPGHIGTGGMGTKVDDFRCLPKCRRHHEDYHRLGPGPFARLKGVDLKELLIQHLIRYITEELTGA